MTAHSRDEVEAVVERYCDVRRRIDAGELPWDALAQFFTDDCVYIDPAWGRVEGIGPVSEFFDREHARPRGLGLPDRVRGDRR